MELKSGNCTVPMDRQVACPAPRARVCARAGNSRRDPEASTPGRWITFIPAMPASSHSMIRAFTLAHPEGLEAHRCLTLPQLHSPRTGRTSTREHPEAAKQEPETRILTGATLITTTTASGVAGPGSLDRAEVHQGMVAQPVARARAKMCMVRRWTEEPRSTEVVRVVRPLRRTPLKAAAAAGRGSHRIRIAAAV